MPVDVGPVLARIWSFVRRETEPRDFEAWICADDAVERELGAALYLDAISTDFRSPEAVDALRDRLLDHARAATNAGCRCIELRDVAVVPMMGEGSEDVFLTLDEIRKRGGERWWLYVSWCHACDQWWLVGAEERQNDVFCLRRLTADEGRAIVDEDRWPTDFDTYEALLELGVRSGYRVAFVDPMYGSSLSASIEELARARPGIKVTELARLLAIEVPVARILAERVAGEKQHLEIALDD
jgi:hypothetical protein